MPACPCLVRTHNKGKQEVYSDKVTEVLGDSHEAFHEDDVWPGQDQHQHYQEQNHHQLSRERT
jgi:hypothetical protein